MTQINHQRTEDTSLRNTLQYVARRRALWDQVRGARHDGFAILNAAAHRRTRELAISLAPQE
jgi:hypothetical protein